MGKRSMNSDKQPGRLIVVLGSHRSGTSAITRGLLALGVELGEHLLPPVAGDNDKGYWEDADINELHNDLLAHLGVSWSDLAWPSDSDLSREDLAPFKLRALEILRGKVGNRPVFGLKNPRISRLLPFWKEVFARLGREVAYVIAVRNPMSVARSIARDGLRGDIPAEKAHYLWLAHMVPSVLGSTGSARVVIDYDRLLADPRLQLARLAAALALPAASPLALAEYADGFLQTDLRHARFQADDFALATELPPEAAEAYRLFDQVAADDATLEDAAQLATFEALGERLAQMRPVFDLVGDREHKIDALTQTRDEQSRVLHERSENLAAHSAALTERGQQLEKLMQSLAHRDAETTRIAGEFSERERQLFDSHAVALVAYGAALEAKEHTLAVQTQELASLNARLAAQESQTAELIARIDEQGQEAARLHERIAGQQQEAASLTDQIGALEHAAQTLAQQINAMEQQASDDAQQLAAREATIATFTEALSRSEAGANDLRQVLDATTQALDESARGLEESRRHGDALARELERESDRFVASGERIIALEAMLVEREQFLGFMQESNAQLSADLATMRAEASTFGAKCGRALTRWRARWAPVDSFAGRCVTRAGLFASVTARQGIATATRMGWRALTRRTAPQALASLPASLPALGERTPLQTDHPQLAAWIDASEPDAAALAHQVETAATFAYRPLISVVIPVYRVPRDVLEETLACLETQTYPNWQACLVWSDTVDTEGWRWLEQRVAGDARYKAACLVENGGISRNSNQALALATGEFIALLDHDDTLTPWALYDVVALLQSQPDLDFIYSDKDSISADGGLRLNALFKPDWSPEMLHSVNYLTHLNIMRTALVREIGGWVPETDGAQDWDIFFRLTERTSRIARIPAIHYHWRILPTSTATGLQAKPYAALGQLKTQQAHFRRKGLPAEVTPTPEGLFHVRWPVTPQSVDIVVMQTGSIADIVTVLDMLRAGTQAAIGSIRVLHTDRDVRALAPFTAVWGDAFATLRVPTADWRRAVAGPESDAARILLLIDGRAMGLSPDLVDELAGWVGHHPEIAWTSAIALHSDGTVLEAGRVIGTAGESAPLFHGSALFSFGWFGGPLWYRNMRAASPYAIAMRQGDAQAAIAAMAAQSGKASDFSALCLQLSADGRRGLVNPFAKVYFESMPEVEWPNDGRLYSADPYFNPAFDQVSPLRLQSRPVKESQ